MWRALPLLIAALMAGLLAWAPTASTPEDVAPNQWTYAVAVQHTVMLGAEPVQLAFDARWRLTRVRVNAEGATWEARLDAPQLRAGLDPRVLPALCSPVRFSVDARGRLLTVALPPALDPLVDGLLRWQIAATRLVVGDGAQWQTTEPDPTGVARIRYRRDGAVVTRERLAYVQLATDSASVEAVRPSGTTRFVLAADGQPARIEVNEVLAVETSLPLSGTRSTLIADRIGAKHETATPTSTPIVERAVTVAPRLPPAPGERPDAATLINRLENADRMTRGQALADLADRLAHAPDEIAAVRQAIRQIDPRDASALLHVLGEVGTPAALEAVADVLSTKEAPGRVRSQAAMALNLAADTTDAALDALWSASEDDAIRRTAVLGLGGAARHRGSLVEGLLTEWRHAHAEERDLWLKALGNSGDPRALEAIVVGLKDPESRVRRAAVGALRHMPESADELLAHAVDDADRGVRGHAQRIFDERQARQ